MIKAEKYEWRKAEKEWYLPKEKPSLVHIPGANYISISGEGNPNMNDFSERVSTLYSVAYAIKMMPKNGHTPAQYFEYTVFPLEEIWDKKEDMKEEELNKLKTVLRYECRNGDD